MNNLNKEMNKIIKIKKMKCIQLIQQMLAMNNRNLIRIKISRLFKIHKD